MSAHNFRDLTGRKFGRLTVLAYAGKYREKQSMWLCKCDCGREKALRACSLTSGHVRSCGCLRRFDPPAGTDVLRQVRSNRVDHHGQRFGRLIVLSYAGHGRWLCRCNCGLEKSVHGGALRSGDTRSCGCLEMENRVKHGLSRTPTYDTWVSMIQRCYNPRDPSYSRYGGRGIKVCSRWLSSFVAFHKDMGGRPSDKHTIDRIDCDGNYEPSNCRWATPTEQQRNRRDNVRLTLNGRTLTVAEWVEVTGMTKETIRSRIRYGWPDERILTEPVHTAKRRKGV